MRIGCPVPAWFGLLALAAASALAAPAPPSPVGPPPELTKADLATRKFTVLSDTSLVKGGATEKYLLGDDRKDVWLFKPMRPEQAYTEEAAGRLAHLFGLPTPYVFAIRAGPGISGSISHIIECKGNLQKHPPATLDARQLGQLLELEVFRWLIGDFDTHCRNFLLDPKLNVITIDHGWAFKEADFFAYDLAAGNAYNENSYFRELWDAWRSGTLELPFDQAFAFIDRVQAVPRPAVDAILAPLAAMKKAAHGWVFRNQYGEVVYRTEEEFLFAFDRRRQDLRQGFTAFIDRMCRAKGLPGYQPAAGSPIAPAAIEVPVVDADPLPIQVADEDERLTPVNRAGRQLEMWVESIKDGGIPRALIHVKDFFKGRMQRLGHALASFASRGLTTKEVADLDLAKLPGGRSFLARLHRTAPPVLARLRDKVVFLQTKAEDPLTRTNAEHLLHWLDQISPPH